VASGVFQGAGSTLMSTVMTAATMWGVRVPLSALLAPRFGLHGVWFAMALQLTVCGILFLIRLHRRRWLPEDMR
jgi:Na+-driven multidrug efflux pump